MFGKRINLFRLLGFEVRIDLSWIIIAILVAWSLSKGLFPFHYGNLGSTTYWVMGVVGALALFASIIAHEFCHSLLARRYGVPMKGITLFIFGGVAEMGEDPPSARAEFAIAAVGPLSSIVLAIGFYCLSALGRWGGWPVPITGVVSYLAVINGVLALFNLLPAFPLDGGRMLRSLLWHVRGDLRSATRISSRVGSFFGILLIGLGILRVLQGYFVGGMWAFLIGMFLRSAAQASYRQLITRGALEGETVQRFMKLEPVTVTPAVTLEELVEDYIYKYHYKIFPVVDELGNLRGCVTTKRIKDIPRDAWPSTTVAQVAGECSPANTIHPHADALEALSAMKRSGASRLMVVHDGRLVGIIALKDMLNFLALKVDLDQ